MEMGIGMMEDMCVSGWLVEAASIQNTALLCTCIAGQTMVKIESIFMFPQYFFPSSQIVLNTSSVCCQTLSSVPFSRIACAVFLSARISPSQFNK